MRPSHVQGKQPHLQKAWFIEIWPYVGEKENSPKWTGWMEAWWLSFSFWLSIYHSWFPWEYGWICWPCKILDTCAILTRLRVHWRAHMCIHLCIHMRTAHFLLARYAWSFLEITVYDLLELANIRGSSSIKVILGEDSIAELPSLPFCNIMYCHYKSPRMFMNHEHSPCFAIHLSSFSHHMWHLHLPEVSRVSAELDSRHARFRGEACRSLSQAANLCWWNVGNLLKARMNKASLHEEIKGYFTELFGKKKKMGA